MKPTTLTLAEAVRLSGKSKSTLQRALKSGKLSYRSKTAAGYEIDPAELARCYPDTASRLVDWDDATPGPEPVETPAETLLRAEIAALREKVELMKARGDELREDMATLRADAADWKAQAQRLAIVQEESAKRSVPSRRWFGLGRRVG